MSDNKGAGSCEDESGEQHETIEESVGEVDALLRRVQRAGQMCLAVEALLSAQETAVQAAALYAYIEGNPAVCREYRGILQRVAAAKRSASGAN